MSRASVKSATIGTEYMDRPFRLTIRSETLFVLRFLLLLLCYMLLPPQPLQSDVGL
jgi:hypothetical protein